MFGGKKEKRGEVPIKKVFELSAKGYSETDIINILRDEGYNPFQVDRALREALKGAVKKPTSQESKKLHDLGGAKEEFREEREDREPRSFDDFDKSDFNKMKEKRKDLKMPKLPGEDEDEFEEEEILEKTKPSKSLDEFSEESRSSARKEIIEPKGFDKPFENETKQAVEELVETVIEEKWETVRHDIDLLEKRFDKIEKRLDDISGDKGKVDQDKSGKIQKIAERLDNYEENTSTMNKKKIGRASCRERV